jgi:hypothetical protein
MTEIARSQLDFSEIELLLSEGKYEEARVLLSRCLEQDPLDRESRLYLLLVGVTLNGPIAYEDDIDRLRDLVDLSETEKEIVRRIFVLGFEAAEKDGREEQAWVYQRLLRRLLLAQALDQPIPKDTTRMFPAKEAPAPRLRDDAFVPARDRRNPARLIEEVIAPTWLRLIALLEKTYLACRSWFRHVWQTAPQPKVSPRIALAITAVTLLIIPIAYFWSPRDNTAKETSSYEPPPLSLTLPRPKIGKSALTVDPVALSQHRDDAENTDRKQVHVILAGQLSDLRRAYGKWVEKDRDLMGSLLVKMQVDGAGNVTKVEELTSRITDADFGEVVLTEIRKWKFPKANKDAAEFTVPLLFVPQGMDPRTIVRWEQALNSPEVDAKAILPLHITSLSSSAEKRDPPANPGQTLTDLKALRIGDASASKTKTPEESPKRVSDYRTRRAAPLRQEPRFAAATAENIDPGTQISVLEAKGDWLKVKTRPSGKVGYVRKEYVAPVSAPQ